MVKYVGYSVYKCPENPTEQGAYIGRTPIYAQAVSACENAKACGKSYFIKGIKADGTEVIIL